jgi:hypothetical protein
MPPRLNRRRASLDLEALRNAEQENESVDEDQQETTNLLPRRRRNGRRQGRKRGDQGPLLGLHREQNARGMYLID